MSRSEPSRSSSPTAYGDGVRDDLVADHELAVGLRAAFLTMHHRANAEFAPFGLTADQFVLVTALAGGDGETQKDLVRRTVSDANTMSEMHGRLERGARDAGAGR